MKITYQGWHTHHELASYRLAVYRNLLESAQTIVLAIRKLNVDPAHKPRACELKTRTLWRGCGGSGIQRGRCRRD
ncbi:hypothetical protein DFH11DRAFT_1634000 [Phellopilus nigrolimitatus]|nr:hypothetical protein DFH11DRAFT_1634000 [Phellopilus nigrolimitatus]